MTPKGRYHASNKCYDTKFELIIPERARVHPGTERVNMSNLARLSRVNAMEITGH